VQASEEFRSLCPTSATCMSKTLHEPPHCLDWPPEAPAASGCHRQDARAGRERV